VACALAEFFWEAGRDVIVIYDDLSSHAKIYRELSLLSRISPGRDSYPGDMFYAHSSLLERAGKLVDKKGTLTALPVVLTPSDDITAYLPTNIMSITDGQIIFDLESFRRGIRPAVNVGLSVSRVGSRVQPKPYRDLGKNILRKLAAYRQAESFSHFGSEMALQTRADLELGKMIYEAFKQPTDMTLGLVEQRLILEVIIRSGGQRVINMSLLREEAQVAAGALSPEGDFNPLVEQLLAKTVMAGPA
jgi:F-type H+-transporting ATPase subunit alpha